MSIQELKMNVISTKYRHPNKIAVVPVVFAAILLVILLTSCQTAGSGKGKIPLDPAVQTGTLSNGLKYYIVENDRPRNTAELQLVVDAGSVLEEEDQQGLAHFLEHMAFNGTDLYPKNELVSFLQDIGMNFGPNINAYTSFDETVYLLSLPTDKEGVLKTGIEVLAQWAFHMSLEEDATHSERGVILEEWRLGRGAGQRLDDKMLPVLLKDSRYSLRLPIGKEQIIQTAEAEPLRRFYSDWYRPDLMAIIAVGDFSAAEVEQYIVEFFSDAPNTSPEKPERTRYDLPLQTESQFAFESDPEATIASVKILNRYQSNPLNTSDDLREFLVESIFYDMINQRLYEIEQKENSPFISPYTYPTSYVRNTSHSVILANSTPGGIEQALKAIFTECERINRYGFLQTELDRARENLYSSFKSYWKDQDNREHSEFVSGLLDHHLEGQPAPSLDWAWKQMKRHIPRIRLEDFRDLMYEHLMDTDYTILISGPEEIEDHRFGLDRAMEIRQDVASSSLEPWVDTIDTVVDTELVKTAPTPGTIRSESYNDEVGIHRWVLSNGATVYIKPTDFKEEEVLFSAFSPGGLSLVSDEDYITATMATEAMKVSGIGDFSAINLEKAITGKNVSLTPYISRYTENLYGFATPEDLETLFQLVYLGFTSVREDQSAWNSYSERMAASLENKEKDPIDQYSRKVNAVMHDDHPRSRNIRAEDLPGIDLQKSINIFRRRFSNAADFTFSFVGAVDLDEIRQLCETWIAGLPASEERETAQDVGLGYFSGSKREEVRAGIETASMVTMAWTGSAPWNYDNLYNLRSLSEVLNILLIEEVREKAGGTYSIGSRFWLNKIPDEDYLFAIQFSADPNRVDELINIVHEQIAKLKENGPAAGYVDKVTEAQRLYYRENLETNNWWDAEMEFIVSNDLDWKYTTEQNRWHDGLTAADIQKAANEYLGSENYAEIILLPKDFE